MWGTVEIPFWAFVLILLFAAVTFSSHFLFPSVRWFFRRRLERAVKRLNERLTVPIEPFRLARRHDMIQRLLYDPEVTEAIVEYAQKMDVREDVAFEVARRYAREIVPSFSAFAYFGFGIRAARWLANMLYDVRTGTANMERIGQIPPDTTVIFVMNHRSNMDYVLVTYLAARASALSYAVGEWARVWPLSRLIRSMGAYFIRRKSRGALYRRVLAKYVEHATIGGVTQAIFPEGGLSLDGALARPKLGLLAYVVQAYVRSGRDVAFVPVAIAYDRVLEDSILISAGETGKRRFRAKISVVAGFVLKKLWLQVRGKFVKFGGAGVVFGEPVTLSSFGPAPELEVLADHLMERIAQDMPLLGVPFVAKTLLDAQAPVTEDDLQARLEIAMRSAPELTGKPDLTAVLAHMQQRGLIHRSADCWGAADAATDTLKFYAHAAQISARAKS